MRAAPMPEDGAGLVREHLRFQREKARRLWKKFWRSVRYVILICGRAQTNPEFQKMRDQYSGFL